MAHAKLNTLEPAKYYRAAELVGGTVGVGTRGGLYIVVADEGNSAFASLNTGKLEHLDLTCRLLEDGEDIVLANGDKPLLLTQMSTRGNDVLPRTRGGR